MKKLLIISTAVFLFFVAPGEVFAQKYKGQVVIGANGAFSLVGLTMNLAFDAIDSVQGLNAKTTPGLSGTVDFGITDRISLGIAHFYQGSKVTWNSYTDSTSGNAVIFTGNFYAKILRQNTGVRALFHFGSNDNVDPYFGIRIGYSYWRVTSNVENIRRLADFARLGNHLLPQAIFGIRYFFSPNIGVNGEFALGFPYYLSAGLNIRFGGQ